jgi:hypothetical protein
MAITIVKRAWSYSAQLKSASNLMSGSSTGEANLQVGDLMVFGWVCDNLTASTPVISNLAGQMAFDTFVHLAASDGSATAAAGVQVGLSYATFAGGLGAGENINITWTAGVTAHAAAAMAFGGGTQLSDYYVRIVQAPTDQNWATTVVPAAGVFGVAMTSLQSATAPAAHTGATDTVTIGTSGGSATTNVVMRMSSQNGGGGSFGVTSGVLGGFMVLLSGALDIAQNAYRFYADDAAQDVSTALAAQDTPITVDLT